METKTIELHSKDELLKACLTKSQRCKASKLYDEMSHYMGRFEEDYEMKKVELTYFEGHSFICIYLEHGMKNDEGTLAQAFARDRAQCFITPRGKVEYYDHKTQNNHILGRYEGIGTIVCAQH